MWHVFPFKIFEFFYEIPVSGFSKAMVLNEILLKTLKRKLCFAVRYEEVVIGVATVNTGMEFSMWNIIEKT